MTPRGQNYSSEFIVHACTSRQINMLQYKIKYYNTKEGAPEQFIAVIIVNSEQLCDRVRIDFISAKKSAILRTVIEASCALVFLAIYLKAHCYFDKKIRSRQIFYSTTCR